MFSRATLTFLDELAAHNDRPWFEANKSRYESLVRQPALDFIAAMAPRLETFAPHFRADPRKVGGSLMRVYRDTRFSRDKTPYKTNIGIQFRHVLGKDVHAPGFYVHIANDECFFGAGSWHPDTDVLGRIRDRIAAEPKSWFSARDNKKFAGHWQLAGDSLARPPRGYAADHPAIEDLKRTDFIGLAALSPTEVTAPGLVELAAARFSAAVPLMKFLCGAACPVLIDRRETQSVSFIPSRELLPPHFVFYALLRRQLPLAPPRREAVDAADIIKIPSQFRLPAG